MAAAPQRQARVKLRIATWNMHAGVGLDGRFAPARIARVLEELDADIVALQEFGSRRAFDMLARLEQAAGARGIAMPTFSKFGCDFGNVVLSRLPVLASACIDLACDRREPRNAVDLVVDAGAAGRLRVVATHLGLGRAERESQLTRLDAVLGEAGREPTVLLGDFNAWRSRALARFEAAFGRARAPATFPSPFPLAALDRILVAPAAVLLALDVHRSRIARIASDHLPLVATLDIGNSPSNRPSVAW
ncbi:MAG: endonuclease [Lysobacteraceae bacterium]|nr:MAG: endonuclease [Xanthomonadaceae bacterium]